MSEEYFEHVDDLLDTLQSWGAQGLIIIGIKINFGVMESRLNASSVLPVNAVIDSLDYWAEKIEHDSLLQ